MWQFIAIKAEVIRIGGEHVADLNFLFSNIKYVWKVIMKSRRYAFIYHIQKEDEFYCTGAIVVCRTL
jgi:hypothetical protein